MTDIGFLAADWPAPAGIRAGTTLRHGGVSVAPFDSFNLGMGTGDDPVAVASNRARLVAALGLRAEPVWLEQLHGSRVADADRSVTTPADASIGRHQDTACAVLTADCLPVLLCACDGSCWGAAHAGWRGLAAGIIEATVDRLPVAPETLMAWLGPSIGAQQFEVGEDVRAAFCDRYPGDAAAFVAHIQPGKYLADIYALARARLQRAGVLPIYGGGLCTISDQEHFYSYRRSSVTGRMASVIWRS